MAAKLKSYTCPECSIDVLGKSALLDHRHTMHGVAARKRNHVVAAANGSPLDAIRELERQIKDKVRDLETERDQLQARILEIDNMVAKWRKI